MARIARAAFTALGLVLLCNCNTPPKVDETQAGEAPVAKKPAMERRFLGVLPDVAENVLAAGEFHEYQLDETADALHAVLTQEGVDLVAQVVDADGNVVLTADSPVGTDGFEHVCFVPSGAGPYHLRIGPYSADASGPYVIRRRPGAAENVRACEEAIRVESAKDKTAELHERSVHLRRRAGEPYPLAIALKEAGRFHARQGDLDAALRYYNEAVEILRSLDAAAADPRQHAAVLNLAGLVQDRAGDRDAARASYEAARDVSKASGNRRGVAIALSNLAFWESRGGDLYKAVETLQKCLDVYHEIGDARAEATTLSVLGGTWTQLGLYEEARGVLRRSRDLRMGEGDPERQANVLLALGWVEHLSGDSRSAAEVFLEALRLYRLANAPQGEAAALDRLGSAYAALDHPLARNAFEMSLDVYRASGDRLRAAHTASNLGCHLRDETLLNEAGASFESLGDRAALAHVRFCQARAGHEAGRLDDARERIEEAVRLVDALRDAALRRGYHAPILDLWQEYSELHVEVLMALNAQEPNAGHAARAFEVSDLARARRLYEMLLESQVDVRSGVPDVLLERERDVQRRLNAAEWQRQKLLQDGAAADAPAVRTLDDRLLALLRELQDVQALIRTASPRFAELRQPSPVRLDDVRGLLSDDTVLLSIVLGERRSFLFVVSAAVGIESHVLPPRPEIDVLAQQVYEGLRHSDQRRTRSQLQANVRRLSRMLLDPVREMLPGKRLLVVGDGMLHYIPFSVLPLMSGEPGEDVLVADRYDVVHLPSAAVMRTLRERSSERPPPPFELAVMGNAVYSDEDERLPSTRSGEGLQLPSLPATEWEASEILKLVPEDERLAVLGFDATADLVRGGVLRSYRILHFATHGFLNEDHPELSGVVLSLFNANGEPRDGHLRLHEVYALDLPADLVVLSGCQTALTGKVEGSGLVGLTHGFFYAGASRLVVSLWDVDDQATAELMVAFYRGLLLDGLSPPAALRAAQREVRSREGWEAPYYWAGFVLQGDWE